MFKKSLIALTVIAATQLTACGSSSDNDAPVTPVNAAPTDITLSANVVAERAKGSEIGTLSATDGDSGETFTFTTSTDGFVIDGTTLSLAPGIALDFEVAATASVEVTVTDSASNTFTKTLDITVEDVQEVYAFSNNDDSVSYSGQIARHLIIAELNNYINNQLDADVDNGVFETADDVITKLNSFFETANDTEYALRWENEALTVSTLSTPVQTVLTEVSNTNKDLVSKIAGNDAKGQHKDWNTEGFVAFETETYQSPEALIRWYFAQIAANVETEINGSQRTDVNGDVITKVYIGENGLDYKQLIQKTLLGTVAFSQGADDYLGSDVEDKGLLTDNTTILDGKNYTNLEHQFDEGFGYFGAARDYLLYTDEEIAAKGGRDTHQGMFDSNADGEIDFNSEYNFGHSQNAAKRDINTAGNTNPTDFTELAMRGFIEGRALINANVGSALTEEQMTELNGYAQQAILNWEKSIAATAVHYINDTTADLEKFGTEEFSFTDVAKHWSELKGFVISLQFNPDSPLSDAEHAAVNDLIGDAPVLVEANVAAYIADLATARTKLQQAYEFDEENVANW
ncbi:DUF4856 domain-containing protein [Psychrosphaera ytuae]|uniref:DUF4856 domain-containing protein n=1 Tax=Psychrosphaera ytuae TaxID=2820710 RepID=A0A975DDM0_9GAMM|nr:DUF4856 domain-containing protein [Psychrosphaera ytuae]QTH64943.1 DUF4856 domain-containing protein [Psychrosphaera ytuae]